jgi:type I restriction enzyme, S subunit
MSDLPKGWTVAAIGEIADINPRHPKDLQDSLPVTFVRMPALSEVSLNFESTEGRLLREVRKGFTHFAEGDVLFAKITPCMENGKAAVATNLLNGLGCGTTELHVMRPLGGIDPKYLFHFVHREAFREEAAGSFTGTAGQLRVPVSFIKDAAIPIPPLNEQRRIVAKLEQLLSRVEAAQERLATIPRILKRFRQSVLAAAYSGLLTADWRADNRAFEGEMSGEDGLPENWKQGLFSDYIAESFYGPRFSKESYVSSGIPTIRTTDMGFDGSIALGNSPCLKLSDSELKKYGLQHGDLLITRTGATIGKCALYDESLGPAIPSAYLIRFRLKPELILAKFALLFFMSQAGQNLLVGGSTAVAQPNVNATTISQFDLNLPPLDEQQEIVRRVEALFKTADALEARYRKAKAHVDKLTQSILAKAFRGELVYQDPNDEPASVLLIRINNSSPISKGFGRRKQAGRSNG